MGENKVIITVSGGVADVSQKPKGIEVVIRDYDVEGCDEGLLSKDEDGDQCAEQVWYEDEEIQGK